MGMKHYTYTTQGTCSKVIDIDVDDNGYVQDAMATCRASVPSSRA